MSSIRQRVTGTENGLRKTGNTLALVFFVESSYRKRVTRLSFSASYYYDLFGYNRWRPQSRAVR